MTFNLWNSDCEAKRLRQATSKAAREDVWTWEQPTIILPDHLFLARGTAILTDRKPSSSRVWSPRRLWRTEASSKATCQGFDSPRLFHAMIYLVRTTTVVVDRALTLPSKVSDEWFYFEIFDWAGLMMASTSFFTSSSFFLFFSWGHSAGDRLQWFWKPGLYRIPGRHVGPEGLHAAGPNCGFCGINHGINWPKGCEKSAPIWISSRTAGWFQDVSRDWFLMFFFFHFMM